MSKFIERPATKLSLAKRNSVHGIGINDANYIVNPRVDGKVVRCPFYLVWSNMIERCYCQRFQLRRPTYIGCTVAKDWLTFSAFKMWMEKQDWQGKQLDKDILILGNKIYSPESCVFVSGAINSLLANNEIIRGEYPQGVSFFKRDETYKAQCKVNGKTKHIGYFKTINKAESAYLRFKSDLILKVARESEAASNPRLQAALIYHAGIMKDGVQ